MKTITERFDDLGKAAYDAYCQQRGWKSVKGDPLPQWAEQDPNLRQAWMAGAEAVIQHANTHCARCGEIVPGVPQFTFTTTGTITPNPPPTPVSTMILQANYCPECRTLTLST